MGRNQSIRSNFGRKNNGQLSYCSICNVHITKITCHEQSKRHIMMSRQHASSSESNKKSLNANSKHLPWLRIAGSEGAPRIK